SEAQKRKLFHLALDWIYLTRREGPEAAIKAHRIYNQQAFFTNGVMAMVTFDPLPYQLGSEVFVMSGRPYINIDGTKTLIVIKKPRNGQRMSKDLRQGLYFARKYGGRLFTKTFLMRNVYYQRGKEKRFAKDLIVQYQMSSLLNIIDWLSKSIVFLDGKNRIDLEEKDAKVRLIKRYLNDYIEFVRTMWSRGLYDKDFAIYETGLNAEGEIRAWDINRVKAIPLTRKDLLCIYGQQYKTLRLFIQSIRGSIASIHQADIEYLRLCLYSNLPQGKIQIFEDIISDFSRGIESKLTFKEFERLCPRTIKQREARAVPMMLRNREKQDLRRILEEVIKPFGSTAAMLPRRHEGLLKARDSGDMEALDRLFDEAARCEQKFFGDQNSREPPEKLAQAFVDAHNRNGQPEVIVVKNRNIECKVPSEAQKRKLFHLALDWIYLTRREGPEAAIKAHRIYNQQAFFTNGVMAMVSRKIVLFDLDGVLFQMPETAVRRKMASDLLEEKTGVRIDSGLLYRYIFLLGQGKQIREDLLIGRIDEALYMNQVNARLADKGARRTLTIEEWMSIITGPRIAAPGALRTLQGLRAGGIKIGVLSNRFRKDEGIWRGMLRDTYGDLIDEKYIFLSSELGYQKPQADLFSKVLGILSLDGFTPQDILFVDDVQMNVEAAVAVGYQAAFYQARPDHDFSSIEEIKTLLGQSEDGGDPLQIMRSINSTEQSKSMRSQLAHRLVNWFKRQAALGNWDNVRRMRGDIFTFIEQECTDDAQKTYLWVISRVMSLDSRCTPCALSLCGRMIESSDESHYAEALTMFGNFVAQNGIQAVRGYLPRLDAMMRRGLVDYNDTRERALGYLLLIDSLRQWPIDLHKGISYKEYEMMINKWLRATGTSNFISQERLAMAQFFIETDRVIAALKLLQQQSQGRELLVVLNHTMGIFGKEILRRHLPAMKFVEARISSRDMHKDQFCLDPQWIDEKTACYIAIHRPHVIVIDGSNSVHSEDAGERHIADAWLGVLANMYARDTVMTPSIAERQFIMSRSYFEFLEGKFNPHRRKIFQEIRGQALRMAPQTKEPQRPYRFFFMPLTDRELHLRVCMTNWSKVPKEKLLLLQKEKFNAQDPAVVFLQYTNGHPLSGYYDAIDSFLRNFVVIQRSGPKFTREFLTLLADAYDLRRPNGVKDVSQIATCCAIESIAGLINQPKEVVAGVFLERGLNFWNEDGKTLTDLRRWLDLLPEIMRSKFGVQMKLYKLKYQSELVIDLGLPKVVHITPQGNNQFHAQRVSRKGLNLSQFREIKSNDSAIRHLSAAACIGAQKFGHKIKRIVVYYENGFPRDEKLALMGEISRVFKVNLQVVPEVVDGGDVFVKWPNLQGLMNASLNAAGQIVLNRQVNMYLPQVPRGAGLPTVQAYLYCQTPQDEIAVVLYNRDITVENYNFIFGVATGGVIQISRDRYTQESLLYRMYCLSHLITHELGHKYLEGHPYSSSLTEKEAEHQLTQERAGLRAPIRGGPFFYEKGGPHCRDRACVMHQVWSFDELRERVRDNDHNLYFCPSCRNFIRGSQNRQVFDRDWHKYNARKDKLTFSELFNTGDYTPQQIAGIRAIFVRFPQYGINETSVVAEVLRAQNVPAGIKWQLHEILIDECITDHYEEGQLKPNAGWVYGDGPNEYEQAGKIREFFTDVLKYEPPAEILRELLAKENGRSINVLRAPGGKHIFEAHASPKFGINLLEPCVRKDTYYGSGAIVHELMAMSGSVNDSLNQKVEEAYTAWRQGRHNALDMVILGILIRQDEQRRSRETGFEIPEITQLDDHAPVSAEIADIGRQIARLRISGTDISYVSAGLGDIPLLAAYYVAGDNYQKNRARQELLSLMDRMTYVVADQLLLELHRYNFDLRGDEELKDAIERGTQLLSSRLVDLLVNGHEESTARKLHKMLRAASVFAMRAANFEKMRKAGGNRDGHLLELTNYAYKKAYELYKRYLNGLAVSNRMKLDRNRWIQSTPLSRHMAEIFWENIILTGIFNDLCFVDGISEMVKNVVDHEDKFKGIGITADYVDRRFAELLRKRDAVFAVTRNFRNFSNELMDDAERILEEMGGEAISAKDLEDRARSEGRLGELAQSLSSRDAQERGFLTALGRFADELVVLSTEDRDWAAVSKSTKAHPSIKEALSREPKDLSGIDAGGQDRQQRAILSELEEQVVGHIIAGMSAGEIVEKIDRRWEDLALSAMSKLSVRDVSELDAAFKDYRNTGNEKKNKPVIGVDHSNPDEIAGKPRTPEYLRALGELRDLHQGIPSYERTREQNAQIALFMQVRVNLMRGEKFSADNMKAFSPWALEEMLHYRFNGNDPRRRSNRVEDVLQIATCCGIESIAGLLGQPVQLVAGAFLESGLSFWNEDGKVMTDLREWLGVLPNIMLSKFGLQMKLQKFKNQADFVIDFDLPQLIRIIPQGNDRFHAQRIARGEINLAQYKEIKSKNRLATKHLPVAARLGAKYAYDHDPRMSRQVEEWEDQGTRQKIYHRTKKDKGRNDLPQSNKTRKMARLRIDIGDLGGEDIISEHDVYAPSPVLTRWVARELPEDLSGRECLDLGTGSGVLGLIMLRKGAQRVVFTDIKPQALMCAEENASRLGVDSAAGRSEFIQSDLFKGIAGKQFDLIVFTPSPIDGGDVSVQDGHIYNYREHVETFFKNVGQFLKPTSRVIFRATVFPENPQSVKNARIIEGYVRKFFREEGFSLLRRDPKIRQVESGTARRRAGGINSKIEEHTIIYIVAKRDVSRSWRPAIQVGDPARSNRARTDEESAALCEILEGYAAQNRGSISNIKRSDENYAPLQQRLAAWICAHDRQIAQQLEETIIARAPPLLIDQIKKYCTTCTPDLVVKAVNFKLNSRSYIFIIDDNELVTNILHDGFAQCYPENTDEQNERLALQSTVWDELRRLPNELGRMRFLCLLLKGKGRSAYWVGSQIGAQKNFSAVLAGKRRFGRNLILKFIRLASNELGISLQAAHLRAGCTADQRLKGTFRPTLTENKAQMKQRLEILADETGFDDIDDLSCAAGLCRQSLKIFSRHPQRPYEPQNPLQFINFINLTYGLGLEISQFWTGQRLIKSLRSGCAHYGERLELMRLCYGLTMERMAAKIGVATLGPYERGERMIYQRSLFKRIVRFYADYFKLDMGVCDIYLNKSFMDALRETAGKNLEEAKRQLPRRWEIMILEAGIDDPVRIAQSCQLRADYLSGLYLRSVNKYIPASMRKAFYAFKGSVELGVDISHIWTGLSLKEAFEKLCCHPGERMALLRVCSGFTLCGAAEEFHIGPETLQEIEEWNSQRVLNSRKKIREMVAAYRKMLGIELALKDVLAGDNRREVLPTKEDQLHEAFMKAQWCSKNGQHERAENKMSDLLSQAYDAGLPGLVGEIESAMACANEMTKDKEMLKKQCGPGMMKHHWILYQKALKQGDKKLAEQIMLETAPLTENALIRSGRLSKSNFIKAHGYITWMPPDKHEEYYSRIYDQIKTAATKEAALQLHQDINRRWANMVFSLAGRVSCLRCELCNWTIRELVERSGVSENQIVRIEQGRIKTKPSADTIDKLCGAFGITEKDMVPTEREALDERTLGEVRELPTMAGRVSRLRREFKWTRREAEDRAGLRPGVLKPIENGYLKTQPRPWTIEKLAAVFHVPQEVLLPPMLDQVQKEDLPTLEISEVRAFLPQVWQLQTIGERVYFLRSRVFHWTRLGLAQKTRLTARRISWIENNRGKRKPYNRTLKVLAKAFKVQVNDLIPEQSSLSFQQLAEVKKMQTLGQKVKYLRKEVYRLSQPELAQAAGVGPKTIVRIENGQAKTLNYKTWSGLSRALHIREEHLRKNELQEVLEPVRETVRAFSTLGEKLAYLRGALFGLSRPQLALRSGVASRTIFRIEKNAYLQYPSKTVLVKLSNTLKVPVTLFDDKREYTPKDFVVLSLDEQKAKEGDLFDIEIRRKIILIGKLVKPYHGSELDLGRANIEAQEAERLFKQHHRHIPKTEKEDIAQELNRIRTLLAGKVSGDPVAMLPDCKEALADVLQLKGREGFEGAFKNFIWQDAYKQENGRTHANGIRSSPWQFVRAHTQVYNTVSNAWQAPTFLQKLRLLFFALRADALYYLVFHVLLIGEFLRLIYRVFILKQTIVDIGGFPLDVGVWEALQLKLPLIIRDVRQTSVQALTGYHNRYNLHKFERGGIPAMADCQSAKSIDKDHEKKSEKRIKILVVVFLLLALMWLFLVMIVRWPFNPYLVTFRRLSSAQVRIHAMPVTMIRPKFLPMSILRNILITIQYWPWTDDQPTLWMPAFKSKKVRRPRFCFRRPVKIEIREGAGSAYEPRETFWNFNKAPLFLILPAFINYPFWIFTRMLLHRVLVILINVTKVIITLRERRILVDIATLQGIHQIFITVFVCSISYMLNTFILFFIL
ncbi:MAG: helix-turn-helix domain-containing protein, partial [Candidatus Omnitrophica bacterium]|nr:helix-turn-helix domain-containing protein [Candidatus Omnitrophota bacterium]